MCIFSVLALAILALYGNASSDFVPSWMENPKDELDCNFIADYRATCDKQSLAYNLNKCCSCRTSNTWEGHEINMIVEYVLVFNKTVILTERQNNSQAHKVESEENRTPSNICNWDTSNRIVASFSRQYTDIQDYWAHIVQLNCAGNQIQLVVDLKCLSKLDTLELQNNRITHISNTSFQNLSFLRNVNFANNLITVIDPYVSSSPTLGLFNVDISNNSLASVNVTNFFSLHPFCTIELKNNQIEEMTNQSVDFILITDGSRIYGPGYVDIRDNIFNTFPDFTELLRLDMAVPKIGAFIDFGFDLRGAKLICDCDVLPYVEVYELYLKSFWFDFLNITCVSPPKYKNKFVHHIPHEKLVCPIGVEGNCPKGCECFSRPEDDSLFVNCSNQGLTEIPNRLPETECSKFIHLDVSYNSITEITNVSYLDKIKDLDISHNNLKFINNTIIENLDISSVSSIDISYNDKLQQLPQIFKYLNACKVHTENLIIECDCESLWIIDWLKNKACHNDRMIFHCHGPTQGNIYGTELREDQIDCDLDESPLLTITTVILMIIALLVIIITIFGYTFKYEILIIWLMFRKTSMNSVVPKFTFDAFLSFDDYNDELFRWVSTKLMPYLEQAGYKLFLPERDLAIGDVRDTETIDILRKTRNFLLILSESYFDPDGHSWIDNEWKYGWNMFKDDKSKNIVIVNYDHMSSLNVDQPQIKAFLRVGAHVEFLNRDSDIFEIMSRKLGPPYKTKFSVLNKKQQSTTVNKIRAFKTSNFVENKVITVSEL